MSAGIDVVNLPDGTVQIVARAPQGTVKLRVTKAYARKLSAKLMGLSLAEEPEDSPERLIQGLIDAVKRRQR